MIASRRRRGAIPPPTRDVAGRLLLRQMRAGRLNFRELADEIFEWLERKVFGSPTWRDMYFAEKAKREETERRLDHFRGIKR